MTNTFEPDFAEADLRERLGRLIDKADNFLAASKLPVSDSIHAQGLKEGIEAIRTDLVALCLARGYEDDWSIEL